MFISSEETLVLTGTFAVLHVNAGPAIPVNNPAARKACPAWRSDTPNLKSSGVLSVDGVLYWAISCFNYGNVAGSTRPSPFHLVRGKMSGQAGGHACILVVRVTVLRRLYGSHCS